MDFRLSHKPSNLQPANLQTTSQRPSTCKQHIQSASGPLSLSLFLSLDALWTHLCMNELVISLRAPPDQILINSTDWIFHLAALPSQPTLLCLCLYLSSIFAATSPPPPPPPTPLTPTLLLLGYHRCFSSSPCSPSYPGAKSQVQSLLDSLLICALALLQIDGSIS